MKYNHVVKNLYKFNKPKVELCKKHKETCKLDKATLACLEKENDFEGAFTQQQIENELVNKQNVEEE